MTPREEEALLSVIRGAVNDPGRLVTREQWRGDDAPDSHATMAHWQARAVLTALDHLGWKITPPGVPRPPAEADSFPLTCAWCRNSPATHLLIADWLHQNRTDRHQYMVCAECGHQATVAPCGVTGWWLFALMPDDPFQCEAKAAVKAGEEQDR